MGQPTRPDRRLVAVIDARSTLTPEAASLRPVAGGPAQVEALVGRLFAEQSAGRSPEPVWVRTSGSSGRPKDVALSATALRASAEATLKRLGGPGQWVLALPAHYVAGLQVIVRSVLSGTSPVVLDDYADIGRATQALTGSRRYLAIVPTQLHRWLTGEVGIEALRSYYAVLLGGGPAGHHMLERARQLGVTVVTTYGMSETCGGCVYDGRPLEGVRVELDRAGVIKIGGPVLFEEYVGRPDLTARVLRDGWLRTPDLGTFDADGRLQVLGRVDDVVVSGGVNVALSAVERRVAAFPGVDQVCMLGMPDAEWGCRVVAVIVASTPPTLAEIRDFVSAVHPRSWAPRDLIVQAELPYLDSGKVDRQRLLRQLTGQTIVGGHGDPDG